MLDAGSWILDPGSWILDPGSLADNKWQKDYCSEGKPDAIEDKWADVVHAHALCHEGQAPYQGGEQEEAVGS